MAPPEGAGGAIKNKFAFVVYLFIISLPFGI
jgi:hypothetical protein